MIEVLFLGIDIYLYDENWNKHAYIRIAYTNERSKEKSDIMIKILPSECWYPHEDIKKMLDDNLIKVIFYPESNGFAIYHNFLDTTNQARFDIYKNKFIIRKGNEDDSYWLNSLFDFFNKGLELNKKGIDTYVHIWY